MAAAPDPSPIETRARVDALALALLRDGLDLVAAGPLAAYNAAVPASFRLAGAADDTIVLVGASRALWPPFLAALGREPWRRRADHPLDGWVAGVLEAAARATLGGVTWRLHHYNDAPPGRVALQHLAAVLGVAGRAPCGLSIHPRHGLWISLRATFVIARPAPALPAPAPLPCTTCVGRPCEAALASALAAPRPGALDQAAIAAAADLWIGVRDACPIGRTSRYSAGQLRWHYRHERAALDEPPDVTSAP